MSDRLPQKEPSNFDENENLDRKSLRKVVGKTADVHELATDCVCFANGSGGVLLIGIEDGEVEPPPAQKVDPTLLEKLKKRVTELTVNVRVEPELLTHDNGGQYIRLTVPRSLSVASTSDGKYYVRIADECHPVLGDDVMRLADERPGTPWEDMTNLGIAASDASAQAANAWSSALRASDRVKASVCEKSDAELLEHYGLSRQGKLTNLGILFVGMPTERKRLGTYPLVQAIKYDERGQKVAKWMWDDYELAPHQLIDAIWEEIPDFRESYELPDGMFRTKVPAFEEAVVREVLVNALVHRPYTTKGDIYLNLHPDRLEVVNPGRLPLGVTPKNILHASRRRNDGMARVFHDLGLMEKEGSGIDLLYDRLLSSGRDTPAVKEGTDSVHLTIPRRVIHPAVIRLLSDIDERFHLSQRERIVIGLLAQSEGLTAVELADRLELTGPEQLRSWTTRLLSWNVLAQSGKTRATKYFVRPELLKVVGLDGRTTLARIEPHRLRELILEDLRRYAPTGVSEIQRRVGTEISRQRVKRVLDDLVGEQLVLTEGENRWRKYTLPQSKDQERSS